MPDDFGIRLGIEGERAFKDALTAAYYDARQGNSSPAVFKHHLPP